MADGGIHDQLGGGFCRYSVDGAVVDPAFREDALRQRAAARPLRRPRAHHRRRPLRGGRARHRRLADARDARAGRRVLLEPRRRQRRRGGQVLRVVARTRSRGCCPPTTTRSSRRISASTGRRISRATRGTCASRVPLAERGRAARRAAAGSAGAARRGEGGAARGARERGCAPASTTRSSRRGTRWRSPGLARAARALDEPGWADLAVAATDALRRTAWRDGRLLATRKGRARAPQCLSRRLRVPARGAARAHADALPAGRLRVGVRARRRAARAVRGSPRAAASSSPATITSALIHRPKPGHDNATPSGNGVAAQALIALGHLAAEPRYVDAGERTVRLYARRARAGAGRLRDAARGARRHAGAAGVGAADRRSGRMRGLAARARSALSPDGARLRTSPAATACRRRCAKGDRRGAFRRLGVPGHAMPAAAARARRHRARARRRASTPAARRRMAAWRRGRFRYDGAAFAIARPHPSRRLHEIDLRRRSPPGCSPPARPRRRTPRSCSRNTAASPATPTTRRWSGRRTSRSRPSTRATPARRRSSRPRSRPGAPGVWGQIPMPPNPSVPDADMKTMIAYILALKK